MVLVGNLQQKLGKKIMKAIYNLPNNYKLIKKIDFNKKRYLISFNLFVIICSLLIFELFKLDICPLFTLKSLIFFALGIYISIFLHELIHGFFIWLFSKKKATYKFSVFYASAGASDRYFDKASYIIIALAPVIFLSILIIVLINFIFIEYYNSLVLILALTFSGAIGDFYISIVALMYPQNTYINDEGEKMNIFIQSTH